MSTKTTKKTSTKTAPAKKTSTKKTTAQGKGVVGAKTTTKKKPKAKMNLQATAQKQVSSAVPPKPNDIKKPQPEEIMPTQQLGVRSPITHPAYKLGDQARDEDMIIFPKYSKRSRRSRRRRRRKRDDCSQDSSCSDDSDDEDQGQSSRRRLQVNIPLAIGHLRHLDAAFSENSLIYLILGLH